MNTLTKTTTKLSLCLALATMFGHANASNISEHLSQISDDRNDNYFRIGIGGSIYDNPFEGKSESRFALPIEARYTMGNFFTELSSNSLGAPGLAAGYTFWEDQNWSIDAILTLSDFIDISEIDRFDNSNLQDRGSSLAAGIRATYFYENYVLQANLLPFDSHGARGSLSVGRYWQLGDWNFTAAAAARYTSSKYNDFYLGVDAEQSSESFPEYQAGAGFSLALDLGVEYQINEDWYFDATLRHSEFSDAVQDSPLILDDRGTALSVSVNYIF